MAHKHLPPPKPTLLGGNHCRRISTLARSGRSVQQSGKSETKEVVAPAGPLALSPPCRTGSASTLLGRSTCTCPARTCSPAATPADSAATEDSPAQHGASGAARVW